MILAGKQGIYLSHTITRLICKASSHLRDVLLFGKDHFRLGNVHYLEVNGT